MLRGAATAAALIATAATVADAAAVPAATAAAASTSRSYAFGSGRCCRGCFVFDWTATAGPVAKATQYGRTAPCRRNDVTVQSATAVATTTISTTAIGITPAAAMVADVRAKGASAPMRRAVN